MGDRQPARWPERQPYAREPPRGEPRDWNIRPPRSGCEEDARGRRPRSRRRYASPRKPITRCWGVRCTVGSPPAREEREGSDIYRSRKAFSGAEGGGEARRGGEGAASRGRSDVPTMSPPPTKFPFAREAGNTSPQTRGTGAASECRKSRRSGSTEAGGPAGRDTGGEAVRIAAGSARHPPDKRFYTGDSGGATVNHEADDSRHSGLDSPQEEW